MPGLFFLGSESGPILFSGSNPVSENSKRSRDQAETSFSKTQTQFLTRNRLISEQDAASQARDTKTARLRELRLEKEAEELIQANAAAAEKKTGKR